MTLMVMTLGTLALVACGGEQRERRPATADTGAVVEPEGQERPGDSGVPAPAGPDSPAGVPAERGPPFLAPSAVAEGPGDVRPPQDVPIVGRVEAARHPAYDRVVLEFDGGPPGYHAEVVTGAVHECGSGRAVELPGQATLVLRLEPARAHDDRGSPTAPRRLEVADLTGVLAAVRICDFEAVVTWAFALPAPRAFRVLSLDGPPRIALDVAHEDRR